MVISQNLQYLQYISLKINLIGHLFLNKDEREREVAAGHGHPFLLGLGIEVTLLGELRLSERWCGRRVTRRHLHSLLALAAWQQG